MLNGEKHMENEKDIESPEIVSKFVTPSAINESSACTPDDPAIPLVSNCFAPRKKMIINLGNNSKPTLLLNLFFVCMSVGVCYSVVKRTFSVENYFLFYFPD